MNLVLKALFSISLVNAGKKYTMEGAPCRKTSKDLKAGLIKKPLEPVNDLPD